MKLFNKLTLKEKAQPKQASSPKNKGSASAQARPVSTAHHFRDGDSLIPDMEVGSLHPEHPAGASFKPHLSQPSDNAFVQSDGSINRGAANYQQYLARKRAQDAHLKSQALRNETHEEAKQMAAFAAASSSKEVWPTDFLADYRMRIEDVSEAPHLKFLAHLGWDERYGDELIKGIAKKLAKINPKHRRLEKHELENALIPVLNAFNEAKAEMEECLLFTFSFGGYDAARRPLVRMSFPSSKQDCVGFIEREKYHFWNAEQKNRWHETKKDSEALEKYIFYWK